MNQPSAFTFTGRIRSVRYALRGVRLILLSQHNAWVHLAAAIVVVLAGFFCRLGLGEWCCIVAAITMVWTAESLNTAFEFLCDVASPEFHPLVEKSKDAAAGAVLLAAIGAVVVGLLVFVPHLAALSK
jgi:diacylglycerol kinase (ATP)